MTLRTAIKLVRCTEFLKKASEKGWDYVWIWRYVVDHMNAAKLQPDRYGVNPSDLKLTLDKIMMDDRCELPKEDS